MQANTEVTYPTGELQVTLTLILITAIIKLLQLGVILHLL